LRRRYDITTNMFKFLKKAVGGGTPMYQVSVTDPQKNGEGMSQYISYKVHVTLNEDGKETQSTTVRRYRDFAWLHSQLFNEFPGALIPPLPEKGLMSRVTEEFIRERQLALETFLKRVVDHKELHTHKHVRIFLIGDEQEFAEALEEKTNRNRAASMQATVNTIVNNVQTMISGKETDLTPDELAIEELLAYVTGLESVMTPAMKTYDSLAKSNNENAKTWAALGKACKMLSETEMEGEQKFLGEVLARLDIASERSGDTALTSFDPEAVQLRRKFADSMRLLKAVKTMVKTHSQRNIAYKNSCNTLKSKQAKLAESTEQSDKLIAQIEEAKAKVEKEKEEVDKLAAQCLEEAASFREKKLAEFLAVVDHFAKIQIENQRNLTKAWSALLPCLESKHSGPI